MVEVAVKEASGLPDDCMLSIRVGTMRRQAAVDALRTFKLVFPAETASIQRRVFRPGGLGIAADWTTGVVKGIWKGGQGDRLGVKRGWQFDTIEGELFSVKLLDARSASNEDYSVGFKAVLSLTDFKVDAIVPLGSAALSISPGRDLYPVQFKDVKRQVGDLVMVVLHLKSVQLANGSQMEVSLTDSHGVPEGSLLSIRSGTIQRQAPVDTGMFKIVFPAGHTDFKIDIFSLLGSAKVEFSADITNYPLDFPPRKPESCCGGPAIPVRVVLSIHDPMAVSPRTAISPRTPHTHRTALRMAGQAAVATLPMTQSQPLLKAKLGTTSTPALVANHHMAHTTGNLIAARPVSAQTWSQPQQATAQKVGETCSYMDECEIDVWVAGVLEDLVREQPSNPWEYIDSKLAEKRSPKSEIADLANLTVCPDEQIVGRVWVPDHCWRGVTLEQLLVFFAESAGDIILDDSEEIPFCPASLTPRCLATKLARLCARHCAASPTNLANLKSAIRNRSAFGGGATARLSPSGVSAGGPNTMLSPNMHAADELLLRPLTEEHRVSVAELWNPRGRLVQHFVSHSWSEDFGDFVQGVYRFALHAAADEVAVATREGTHDRARSFSFYIGALARTRWSSNDAACDGAWFWHASEVIGASSTKSMLLSLDQYCAVLQRAWCHMELYFMYELEKPLALNTPYGILPELNLQSKAVQSWLAYLLGTLSDIDVSMAIATEPADLQRLLRSIFVDSGGVRGTGVADGFTGADAVNKIVRCMMSEKVLPLIAATVTSAAAPAAPDGEVVGFATRPYETPADEFIAGFVAELVAERGDASSVCDIERGDAVSSGQSRCDIERGDAEQSWEELLSDPLLQCSQDHNENDDDSTQVFESLGCIGAGSIAAELACSDLSVRASALQRASELSKSLRGQAAPLAPALGACLLRAEDSDFCDGVLKVLSSIGASSLRRFRGLFPDAFNVSPLLLQAPQGSRQCSRGHKISFIEAWCGGTCDLCSKRVAKSDPIGQCTLCSPEWWICATCLNAEATGVGKRIEYWCGESTWTATIVDHDPSKQMTHLLSNVRHSNGTRYPEEWLRLNTAEMTWSDSFGHSGGGFKYLDEMKAKLVVCSVNGGNYEDDILECLVAILPEALYEISIALRSNIRLTDIGLGYLGNCLPQGLRELRLDLRCNSSFTDRGLCQLAATLPPCLAIFLLDLRGSEKLTDVGIAALGDGLPRSIAELRICLFGCRSITDGGLARLAWGLPAQMTALVLDFASPGNGAFSDTGLTHLAAVLPQELSEFGIRVFGDRNFTDIGLEAVAASLSSKTGLRNLALEFYSNQIFTDRGLCALADALLAGLSQLTLDFHCNGRFSDLSLERLALVMPTGLTKLSLDFLCNVHFSEAALAKLAHSLPMKLEAFLLAYNLNAKSCVAKLKQRYRVPPDATSSLHMQS
jgi:hypothetical protein